MKFLGDVYKTTSHYKFHVADDLDMVFSVSIEDNGNVEKVTFENESGDIMNCIYDGNESFVVNYCRGHEVADEIRINLEAMEEVFAGQNHISFTEFYDYWCNEYSKLPKDLPEELKLNVMLTSLFADMHKEWRH